MVPTQYLCNVMTMIPKRSEGAIRGVAAMSSCLRNDTKMPVAADRKRNASISHKDDTPKLGGSWVQAMEDRQRVLDVLVSLSFDTIEELCGLINFYDAMDYVPGIDPGTRALQVRTQQGGPDHVGA